MEKVKERKAFPFYVTRKMGLAPWKYWLIRVGGILLAFLLAGIVCTILKPGTFGLFYSELIRGCFDFNDFSTVIDLLILFSYLLLVALALTPAFKMKFWNIGAEGQILFGALASAGIAKFASPDMPNAVVLLLCFLGGVLAGIIWSVIPTIFKAFFHTNETLFTLMLNYVAVVLSAMCIDLWDKSGHKDYGLISNGVFPEILGNQGTIIVLFAALVFVYLFFYLKKSKHGYEMSVVGESINTARYVGIDEKVVTIRTMIMTGGIMGLIGFLLVCAVNQSFFAEINGATIVGGKGFTGVLIAWLGHFEPVEIALFSFLSAVMEQGTTTAASNPMINISSTQFANICTGIFFFVIIACEFFSNYQIKRHHDKSFDAYFNEIKMVKKDRISKETNRFKRFWMWTFYYISYPVVWLIHDLNYKKSNNAQKQKGVGE